MIRSGSEEPFKVPVLVLGHSRPDTTAQVLESLRPVSPGRIYLAIDGPRLSKKGEAEKVRSVQEVMTGGIDWPCEVETLFREENLGIREGIAESITWFFENEEMGIVLEDDCVPGRSFFPFCEAMLERYRDEPEVMHVGGSCFIDTKASPFSYFFSRYPLIWGWASWADRWKGFTLDGSRYEDLLADLQSVFPDPAQEQYWSGILRRVLDGRIKSWDYFWTMSIWQRGGLAIHPTVPLVRNIGFSSGATNTKWWKDYRGFGRRGTAALDRIEDPPDIEGDRDLDREVFEAMFLKPSIPVRLAGALREAVRRRQYRTA